jgi:deoxycytidine triphosphate deaminase
MFGNLATNRQIKTLLAEKCIYIQPYDPKQLKSTGYTLNPRHVLRKSDEGEWEVVHTFSEKKGKFELAPNEYVLVEPKQNIRISADGIVGRFTLASSNIESGLLIVAGQIDSKYGMGEETLRFGVKNLLDAPNFLTGQARLVHLEIFDLRGSTADPLLQSPERDQLWRSRVRDPRWERDDSDHPLPREDIRDES